MTSLSSAEQINLELDHLVEEAKLLQQLYIKNQASAADCTKIRIYKDALCQYVEELRSKLRAANQNRPTTSRYSRFLLEECSEDRTVIDQSTVYMQRLSDLFHKLERTGIFVEEGQVVLALFDRVDRWLIDSHQLERQGQAAECADVTLLKTRAEPILEELNLVEHDLVNLAEDRLGVVRVYIKIKPTGKDQPPLLQIDRRTVTLNNETFGPFYGVFPPGWTNMDLYNGQQNGTSCDETPDTATPGICRVAHQLEDGYHLVLFASGASGAGKTTTLFGNNLEAGLAELTCADMRLKGFTVTVQHIFELATNKVDFLQQSSNSGQIIDLYRAASLFQGTTLKVEHIEGSIIQPQISKLQIDLARLKDGDLNRLRVVLDSHRARRGRIVATPNNPQSSRSHLFIIISFQKDDGTSSSNGLLTIFDSAGLESPLDILSSFWQKPAHLSWNLPSLFLPGAKRPAAITSKTFTPTSSSLGWIYRSDYYSNDNQFRNKIDNYVAELNYIAADSKKVVEIIKQSVFINYSLNDLQFFFEQRAALKKEGDETTRLPRLATLTFPVREQDYSPHLSLRRASDLVKNDQVGMYTVLQKLSQLSSLVGTQSPKPIQNRQPLVKFVLLAHVRNDTQPTEIVRGTEEMLTFAEGIRST